MAVEAEIAVNFNQLKLTLSLSPVLSLIYPKNPHHSEQPVPCLPELLAGQCPVQAWCRRGPERALLMLGSSGNLRCALLGLDARLGWRNW